MVRAFQAASLVASPSYPNSVAWSDENLVAVASGHIVTILNPAAPSGPRCLITIPASKPFPIGIIERKDLVSGCLLRTCLSRETRPCVRSISWSPVGFAPNGGCLLAVCTTDGRVRLYRMPFCEFSAEWIEVLDISEILFTYLVGVDFGESDAIPSDAPCGQVPVDRGCADDMPISALKKKRTQRIHNAVVEMEGEHLEENSMQRSASVSGSKAWGRSTKRAREDCSLQLLTAKQYASRHAFLSSLVLAWSPVLDVISDAVELPNKNLPDCCSVLAVGVKTGRISFWKINKPRCYSITCSKDPMVVSLIGFLQAHDTWITSICWVSSHSDTSTSQLVLATGSSDGSVRIWQVPAIELLNSQQVDRVPFLLVKEVITTDFTPVSVLSCTLPSQLLHKMLLAIGKGSGSFEVWICNVPDCKFEKAGSHDAHDQVITGLAWAFGGGCLYSCSQDNSVRSWNLRGSSLSEVPFPLNIPGARRSTEVPDAFDSCSGLAVSPGNLVVAVARNYDTELLNPMYESRTLKAAVEFLWIGGQQLDVLSFISPDLNFDDFPRFSKEQLLQWEDNILWSLDQYKMLNKPLVVWDIVAALLVFKYSFPKYMDHVLLKWLASGTGLEFRDLTAALLGVSKFLSKMTSRQLHLINIVIRQVVLDDLKADKTSNKLEEPEGLGTTEDELTIWMELLLRSEKELRERIVDFTFSAVLNFTSDHSTGYYEFGCWRPVGVAQMEHWTNLEHENLNDHLKPLTEEFAKVEKSYLQSTVGYAVEEQCGLCSASVPFESPEFAICSGLGDGHKLTRCAVSMQLCPATSPSWFCICCERRVSKLAPRILYELPGYPSDFKSLVKSFKGIAEVEPCCPFCGILLQRLQPTFLLSPSPV